MAGNVTIPNVFQAQTGPLALSALDANFTALANSVNSVLTFSSYYTDSSGAANSVIVTVSAPQTFNYVAGATLQVKINNTNTGATTINVNALGTKSITTVLGGALVAGQIVAGGIVQLIYDGTNFQLATAGGASFAGGSNTQVQYNNGGVLAGSALTYNNSTGGFSIAAPSSGTALTVTPASGGVAAALGYLQIQNDNGFVASGANLYTTSTTPFYFGTGGGAASAWYTNSAARIAVASAGNVTINAPASGYSLLVNGGSFGITVADGTGNWGVQMVAGASYVGATSNHSTAIRTNNTDRISVAAAGNVTINAPSSGTGLTSIGVSSQFAILAVGSSVSGSSYGLGTQAGFTSADYSAIFRNYGGTTLAYIRGDGQSFFNQNVTINAPASGTALNINAGASSYGQNIQATAGNFAYLGLSGNGNTLGSGDFTISQDASNAAGLFNRANAGMYLGTNSTVRLAISAPGNVTINAPTSGFALAVSGQTQINAAAIDEVLQIRSTSNPYISWYQAGSLSGYIQTSGTNFYIIQSTAGTMYFSTGGNNRLAIGNAGNVTINAPSSGIALNVNNIAGNYGVQVTDGTCSTFIYTNGSGGSAFGNSTNQALSLYTNNAQRMLIAANGNVTIYAPTSGAALAVTAATGGSTNAGLVVTGSASTPTSAVTFSATAMTIDCTRSNVFTTTFTANVTTAPSYSDPQDGQTINWFITQDATGTRTMTWGTSVKWPGGTAGVLSTAANAVDLLVMTYRSSTGFWYATLSKGFA